MCVSRCPVPCDFRCRGPELPMSTRIVGDYEAYRTKVITLDSVKFTEAAHNIFSPFSQATAAVNAATAANGSTLGCTVSEESLKRVGVDVLQLVACPLLSVEDVKQALAVDPCVASVEVDQQLTVDVFGIGPFQDDIENPTPHSPKAERWAEAEATLLSSHAPYTGDEGTWTVEDESGREEQRHFPRTHVKDCADRDDVAALGHQVPPYGTRSSSFRAKVAAAQAVQAPKFVSTQNGARECRKGTSLGKGSVQPAGQTSRGACASGGASPSSAGSAPAAAPESRTSAAGDMPQPADASARVEKFVQPRTSPHESDSRPHSSTDTQGDAAPKAFPVLTRTGPTMRASMPDEAPTQRAGSGKHLSDLSASIEELFLFQAFLPPSPDRGERNPKDVHVPEKESQSLLSADDRFALRHQRPPLLRTATSARTEGEPVAEAHAAVAATIPLVTGSSAAEEKSEVAAEQRRPRFDDLPLPVREVDDVHVSYWRTKSGFHTRAYELASCEKNRVIAVIDTGIAYSHPALAANVWVNEREIPNNNIDDDKNGFVDDVYGYNFRDNKGDPMDDHGHGTHVAGIIGALEYGPDQVVSHARRRKRWMSEKQPTDDMQREGTQQGQSQQEEKEDEDDDDEEEHYDDEENAKEEDQLLRAGKQQEREVVESLQLQGQEQPHQKTKTEESQQERKSRHYSKKPRESVYQDDPARARKWGVRVQQGVCGETSIAGLKFMGAAGNGATSDAIKALNYAVQMNMKLSCNSWGGPSWSEALVAALEAADENGHLFIAAAGNQGKNIDEIPHYPASYQLPNVISVAATTIDDELAPFSNRGARSVDVAAPGVKIRSTFPPDRFKELSGTSMATPVVAGLAAMLMSLPYDNTKQIKDAILKGVDKIPAVAGLVKSGGRINAEKSVAWLVNELDLDVDFMLQRKHINFALPNLYSLFDDGFHDLAPAWRKPSSNYEVNYQRVQEEGRATAAQELIETDKKRKETQADKEKTATQSGVEVEGHQTDKSMSKTSEKSTETRDTTEVECNPKETGKDKTVLSYLQGGCLPTRLSSSSV